MSKKDFIYLLGICLIEIICITGQVLGLNVIIFMIPLLSYLLFYLKENHLILHKKGILLIIPILVLSISFLIYDNSLKYLNIIGIPLLTIVMIYEIINPITNLEDLFQKGIYALFKSFDYLISHIKNTVEIIKEFLPKKNTKLKRLKSYLIVIPIFLVVLILLSSADLIFASIFKDIIKFLDYLSFEEIVRRVIHFTLIFLFLGAFLLYLKKEKGNVPSTSTGIKVEDFTIKLLLTLLNGTYIVFNCIQIFSLGFHKLPANITYAEYARTGFFQLMIISMINIGIILISKKSKSSKYIKGMNLLMVLLTFLIMLSSFYRMYLYEQVYGYTLLRIGVYLALVTEAILLIPTIFYILKKDFKVFKYYLMIPIIIYTILNLVSIDKIITNRNIALYRQKNKIDIEYLQNENADNIEELLKFYETLEEKEMKESLRRYLKLYQTDSDNIFEYNISKEKAKTLLKEELK